MKKSKYKLTSGNHSINGKKVEVGTILDLTEKEARGLLNKVVPVEEATEPEPTKKPETVAELRTFLEAAGIGLSGDEKKAELEKLYQESLEEDED